MDARTGWWWLLGGGLVLLALSRTERGAELAADAVSEAVDMAKQLLPRGLRNNNPGNIRHNAANQWRGMASSQPDREFVTFVDMPAGVRALARVLTNYQRQGLDTVRAIVNRWAPPQGRRPDGSTYAQNTSAYVTFVARRLGVAPDARIDVRARLPELVRAIARHENGPLADSKITDADIAEGLRRLNA